DPEVTIDLPSQTMRNAPPVLVIPPDAARLRFERALAGLLRAAGIAPAAPVRAGWSPYRFRSEAGLPGDGVEAAPVRLAVGAVKAFVEAHADETLDLERLAREAHLSKYHFARTFREAE